MLRGKIIDADGHILEPVDLWQNYLEARFKDRAIRMDTGDDGVEYLVVENKPLPITRGIGPTAAGIGQPLRAIFEPGRFGYRDGPAGAYDAQARLQRMDTDGIDISVLFPTLGLIWEPGISDVELSSAYCRAYNNWILDFCSADPNRLIPVAHLVLLDIDAAITEAKRVAKLGHKGVFVCAAPANKRAFWDRAYDPLWAVLQEYDLSIGFHTAVHEDFLGHQWIAQENTDFMDSSFVYFQCLPLVADVQAALAALFQGAVFDRFPSLKVNLLEVGAGWIPHALDRWDSKYQKIGYKTGLKHLPSEYFARQCWISFDPDETTIAYMAQRYGAERFVWASDFPHWDGSLDALGETKEAIASLAPEAQQCVLGDNVARLYNLT